MAGDKDKRYSTRLLSMWNAPWPQDISILAWNLLLKLADMYRKDKRGAWVGVAWLASFFGRTEKQIRDLINQLETHQYLRVYEDRRKHSNSIYVVPLLPGEQPDMLPTHIVIPDEQTINDHWTLREPKQHQRATTPKRKSPKIIPILSPVADIEDEGEMDEETRQRMIGAQQFLAATKGRKRR